MQRVAGRLPQAHRLDGLLLRYVTRSLALDEARFMRTWRQAQRHLRAHYLHGGRAPALDTVIEFGTGGYPIVPLGLALSGARRVLSFDDAPRLAPTRVLGTLAIYRRLARAGRLPALEPDACDRIDEVLARAQGRSAQWMLEAFGVDVRRVDAHRTGLPEGSVDLFVSNDMLDRVPSDVLRAVFREFHRVGHDGSVMSHRLHHPSRSRLPDARAMHRETRWLILEEDVHESEAWITSAPAPDRTH